MVHYVHCFACGQDYTDSNDRAPHCCGACGSRCIGVYTGPACFSCKTRPAKHTGVPYCQSCVNTYDDELIRRRTARRIAEETTA